VSRYTVDLTHLARFIGTLDEFNTRSEEVGAAIDRQIAELHENWSGMAASAHREYHRMWTQAAEDLRAALAELKQAAHRAHHHYTDAIQRNVAMLRS